jgi:hypothetical protein
MQVRAHLGVVNGCAGYQITGGMKGAELKWEREYEALAAMLRGAPRVPWSAPKNAAARRAAVSELVFALEEWAKRARDEHSRRVWSIALERAQKLHRSEPTSSAA